MEEETQDVNERSHAFRTKKTRESILNAVISLLREGGYSAATSGNIAKRAGVTWGAVQHHFGSKEEILYNVLQLSLEHLIEHLKQQDMRQGHLAERTDKFVDCLWLHYQSDISWAAIEIMLAMRSNPETADEVNKVTTEIAVNCLKNMKEIFIESPASDEDILHVLSYSHGLLIGLALQTAFIGERQDYNWHLKRIKNTVYNVLEGF